MKVDQIRCDRCQTVAPSETPGWRKVIKFSRHVDPAHCPQIDLCIECNTELDEFLQKKA